MGTFRGMRCQNSRLATHWQQLIKTFRSIPTRQSRLDLAIIEVDTRGFDPRWRNTVVTEIFGTDRSKRGREGGRRRHWRGAEEEKGRYILLIRNSLPGTVECLSSCQLLSHHRSDNHSKGDGTDEEIVEVFLEHVVHFRRGDSSVEEIWEEKDNEIVDKK